MGIGLASAFILAALVSFIGSLQPGPVNMVVLTTAAKRQYGKAALVAVGGSLPELLFSGIALWFTPLITIYQDYLALAGGVLAVVFLIAGGWLFSSRNVNTSTLPGQTPNHRGFLTGFMLALANPQLMLFWAGVITLFALHEINFTGVAERCAFAAGTAIGALMLHLALLQLIRKKAGASWILLLNTYSNKILGTLFMMIGVLQLGSYILH